MGVKTPRTWDPVSSSLDENILPFILKYFAPTEAIITGNTLTSKRLPSREHPVALCPQLTWAQHSGARP